MIALYRLLVQHQPADEVLREMQYYKYNYDMSPQLLDYLNDNLPALAEELVRNGASTRFPTRSPPGSRPADRRDHTPTRPPPAEGGPRGCVVCGLWSVGQHSS